MIHLEANSERRPARSAEERAAGPDQYVRCKTCDQGILPGEVFKFARECCLAGHSFDLNSGVPERVADQIGALRSE